MSPPATPNTTIRAPSARATFRDVAALRAERHPKAEITRTTAKGISHDAVDTDGGNKKGDRREYAQEFQSKPARCQVFADDLVHGSDAVDRDARVHRLHLVANRLAQYTRIAARTQVYNRYIRWRLRFRNVDSGCARRIEAVRSNVTDDPDNGQIR